MNTNVPRYRFEGSAVVEIKPNEPTLHEKAKILKERMEQRSIKKAKQVIDSLKTRAMYSCDANDLSYHETHLVFIVGRLQRNDPCHSMYFKNSKYLGRGVSLNESYMMYKMKTNSPVVIHNEEHFLASHLKGEVYAVPLENLLHLDYFESNQNLTQRHKLYVDLIEQEVPLKNHKTIHPVVQAWTYIGMPSVYTKDIIATYGTGVRENSRGTKSWVFQFTDFNETKVG